MPWLAFTRPFAYWARGYRRVWPTTLISGALSPTLFLLAMGVGLGRLVGRSHGPVGGVSYLDFLAPGLLAAWSMQVATGESLWPVLGAVRWYRTYDAMLATPLRVVDVLVGHLAWIAVRLAISASVFLAVIAAFGAVHSWWAIGALPAAVLTGLAFATPFVAFAGTQRNDQGFAMLFRFLVMPLFLFSGTFFPVSQLPGPLRPVAYATPLWQGVELCRALVLGRVASGAIAEHVGYLAGLVAIGGVLAYRVFQRRLRA